MSNFPTLCSSSFELILLDHTTSSMNASEIGCQLPLIPYTWLYDHFDHWRDKIRVDRVNNTQSSGDMVSGLYHTEEAKYWTVNDIYIASRQDIN